LYNLKGGDNEAKEFQMALLWTLNLSDGRHSTLDIAKRSGIQFRYVVEAANRLLDCKLLKAVK
jgi:aminopeptidase-like protein